MPFLLIATVATIATMLAAGSAPVYILSHPKCPDDPVKFRASMVAIIGLALSGAVATFTAFAVMDNLAPLCGWAAGIGTTLIGLLALTGTVFVDSQ